LVADTKYGVFPVSFKIFQLPQSAPDTKVAEIGASVFDFFLKNPKIKPSKAIDRKMRGIT
jgi:hypothetical protein